MIFRWKSQDRSQHLADEDLLMLSDGEVSAECAATMRVHLADCWPCRARAMRMEQSMADFVELYEQRFHRVSLAGPAMRASLWGGMRSMDGVPQPLPRSIVSAAAYAAILLVLVVGGSWFVLGQRSGFLAQRADPALPIRSLTPGFVEPVSLDKICRMADSDDPPAVDFSIKQQVFDEYRLPVSSSASYELDYLITPQLGGANDAKNLWPEPYSATDWNAHIKDQLEDRLHAMVCDGSLNIETAQKDISVDWIAAYKKYFHTQVPLTEVPVEIQTRLSLPMHRGMAGF